MISHLNEVSWSTLQYILSTEGIKNWKTIQFSGRQPGTTGASRGHAPVVCCSDECSQGSAGLFSRQIEQDAS